MNTELNIGFDYSHDNKLDIENTGFSDFVEYLFNSDFKIGKIEAGLTYEKLSKYNIFIIGVPMNKKYLTPEEIEDVLKYIRDGGSLLAINDRGGDFENNNNLSELTKYFGVRFNSDSLYDNENFSKNNSRPVINNFKRHFITRDLNQIIHSGGCTLEIDKSVEDTNINIQAIAFSSEDSSWHKVYKEEEWVDEPVNKAPILAAGHYGLGKVVMLANLSLISGFNDQYGIRGADNFKLIMNIVSWLFNKVHSEEAKFTQPIYCTMPIEQDLYYWIKDIIEENDRWNSIQELINFALNVVKIRMKNQETQKEG
ncbi:MAG: hypothetical protein ACTSV5_03395 [Promethearchaeota archaeon]